jgi:hypothetical protein
MGDAGTGQAVSAHDGRGFWSVVLGSEVGGLGASGQWFRGQWFRGQWPQGRWSPRWCWAWPGVSNLAMQPAHAPHAASSLAARGCTAGAHCCLAPRAAVQLEGSCPLCPAYSGAAAAVVAANTATSVVGNDTVTVGAGNYRDRQTH